jgi:uncharacterized protein Yka (UPF0111/DUF47 family)
VLLTLPTSFLLQAPPPPATVPAWLAYVGLFALIVSVLSILLNVILALRKESREDGQTMSQRVKKMESTVAQHDQQRQAEVQARERLGETLLREYGQFQADIERRTQALETKASELPPLRERIASMEADLKRLASIEHKIDELTRLLIAKV